MIKEQGVVVGNEGRDVIVEVVQTSACKSCSARQGCGQAVLSEWGDSANQEAKNHFRIPSSDKLAIGSVVQLAIHPDALSKVAAVVYLAPLLVAFLALWAAEQLSFSEPVQLLVLLLAMGGSFVGLARFNRAKGHDFAPKITHVSPPGKGADIIVSTESQKV